jgi:cell division protein ZipA
MTDANQLRIIIAILGAILLAVIYFFGRPRKPGQGKRKAMPRVAGVRREPVLGDAAGAAADAGDDGPDAPGRADGDESEPVEQELPLAQRPGIGARGDAKFDRVVSLYVTARSGETIGGPELVVAAEKAGLEFGDMDIFHRMVEGKPGAGPVFSVANMVKPGSFEMGRIGALRTPGVTFFMTLPGPIPALDAWDMMLPAAQRVAELLDAQVLDDERNALGRQRIQHLREELRAFDRQRERNVIKRSW